MTVESHTLLDGKVHVYRRVNSRFWQCATFLGGRNHRRTTRQENLALATEFARDWYMDRYTEDRVRRQGGQITPAEDVQSRPTPDLPYRAGAPKGPSFKAAAEGFLSEYQVVTLGERNPVYVANKLRHAAKLLVPFFGETPVGRISAGRIQEYRVSRVTKPADADGDAARRPARSTLHSEMVTLRQILKWANRKGWIDALPDMSAPYKGSGKVSHRAWFSPDEYKRLYEATRARAKTPKNKRWRGECETFHDYVLFMANTGLRPDEASRLEYRDVSVVVDEATGERILEIEVRGKRGVGYCKSMTGAVLPFQRLRRRANPDRTDLIFGKVQRELLNAVLDELGLKRDREGTLRTAYSLRHTYICMRLMEGADIYQIAKNCRTSVEMIEKFYASHIKNTLDAAAINVRKPARQRAGIAASPESPGAGMRARDRSRRTPSQPGADG
jgi:integrase